MQLPMQLEAIPEDKLASIVTSRKYGLTYSALSCTERLSLRLYIFF